MPLVYVFAASKMEAQPVLILAARDGASSQGSGALIIEHGADRLALIITGMGTRNAEAKADAALGLGVPGVGSGRPLADKPDAVLVIGLCGGLTETLPEQHIVAYTECLSTGPNKPPLQCSLSLTDGIVRRLQQQGIAVDRVIGVTSSRIATTKADRLALAKASAAVVDMESYPIVSAAARAGVPAVVLRVVSDSLDTEMPDFNRALNAEGALDGRRALWVALGSPLETLRLLAANRRAMERLKPAVKLIVESGCFSRTGHEMKN